MGKQRVEHPTTYKSRMAADRMSVLLVIDRELLAPYTKAAKEARIDRNSVLVAALGQTLDGGKAVSAAAVDAARKHNANTDRSAALRARQDAMRAKQVSTGTPAFDPVKVKALKAVAAKLKKSAKATGKLAAKARAKSVVKSSKSASKPKPATAEVKAKAKLPIKRANANGNSKVAVKSKNKAASVPASAKTNAKGGKALAGASKSASKPKRLIGISASKAEQMYIDDGSKSANMPIDAPAPAGLKLDAQAVAE